LCATLFDLGGFGQLNSDYGSARGDQILREIGQRLRQWNQTVDLVGRYAGNRFLVVAIDTDEPTATRHAEQTRQLIEALLPCDASRQEHPTVQTANGRFAADDTPEALLARLETALDEARGSLAIGEPAAVDATPRQIAAHSPRRTPFTAQWKPEAQAREPTGLSLAYASGFKCAHCVRASLAANSPG
jgi:diguanylate cyclase (GGDEF)-like protein